MYQSKHLCLDLCKFRRIGTIFHPAVISFSERIQKPHMRLFSPEIFDCLLHQQRHTASVCALSVSADRSKKFHTAIFFYFLIQFSQLAINASEYNKIFVIFLIRLCNFFESRSLRNENFFQFTGSFLHHQFKFLHSLSPPVLYMLIRCNAILP